ncbi:hypothetical protein B0H19DRAFT_1260274 [Mycena capillaripes]|nr:hypothetical protein B0H19DRAFT_1260274 [Mycena capillaripes]
MPRHSGSTMVGGKKHAKSSPRQTSTRRSTRLQAKNSDKHNESSDVEHTQDCTTRDESPPWLGIEGSRLPSDDDSIHGDSHMSSSSEDEAAGEEDNDPTPDLSDLEAPANSQAARARSPRWQSWQDRYLVQAVDQTRPFLLDPSEREEGWNETAAVLLRDSRAVGPRSIVDRTGSACKNRFMKLMKEHKKGETESRMKTGAVEEISGHIKLMTALQAIMDDHAELAKESSSQSKKADMEEKAGKELRDAAMKGLARSEGLIDVSQLDSASVREKQGQRKRARRPLSPAKHQNRARSSDDASSDVEPLPKRRRKNQAIHDVLQHRNDEDAKRLKDARKHSDQQHNELLRTQNETLHVLVNLTNEIKGLREDNRARRDVGESSRTTELLAELVAKKF